MSLSFAIKAQAREEVADSHIESLVAQADSCKQQNNLYRALTIYEEAYKYEASADVLRKIIQCHYERGGYQQCLDLYQAIPSDSLTVGDLKMKYFCFSNVAAVDSALYYGREANRVDPYDSRVVAKLASHYNKAQLPDTAFHIADA
jgi:tetratricopeptide (TPR) repeat protein